MSIQTLLEVEIQNEFEKLDGMEVGTEQYKATVDGLTKLMDRAIEMDRIDLELQKQDESREFENDLKLKQMEEDKKDRLIKNIMTASGIVLPIAVTVWGTLVSFKFEQEGTITTIMGRGFINKLLPKK